MTVVLDYRFILSDGTSAYVILKGSEFDDRTVDRVREAVNRTEDAMIEKGILRAHGVDRKPGKLKAI